MVELGPTGARTRIHARSTSARTLCVSTSQVADCHVLCAPVPRTTRQPLPQHARTNSMPHEFKNCDHPPSLQCVRCATAGSASVAKTAATPTASTTHDARPSAIMRSRNDQRQKCRVRFKVLRALAPDVHAFRAGHRPTRGRQLKRNSLKSTTLRHPF